MSNYFNYGLEENLPSIENIEEIVSQKAIFSKGYRGFIQFIILRIISEKMRDKNDKRNIN